MSRLPTDGLLRSCSGRGSVGSSRIRGRTGIRTNTGLCATNSELRGFKSSSTSGVERTRRSVKARSSVQATQPTIGSKREASNGIDDLHVPYREGGYDATKAKRFYNKRWWISLSRQSALALRLGLWSWGTFVLDKNMGKEEENKELRSRELLKLINDVGPTAIKIGQALSIRSDIIDPVYAKTLSELQDKVPPFSSDLARAIIEEELGLVGKGGISAVFDNISPQPVAAASIGQVYKATLKNGVDVAVKVQRPEVLNQIAVDLHVAREFAPIYKKILKANTDFVGLVDEWGRGFIDELDYPMEAAKTRAFTDAMRKRGLNAVSAPEVVSELSSKHVLTTKWVEGKRLDAANTTDCARLCGVALNAYLTMLLDLGTLHCDPHPGNLLRTPDGKLCILDFGMTTNVPTDLQYGLLEYIAHLTIEDYDKIPDDLIKLGFVPEGQEEMIKRSGIVEVLSFTLRQLAKGGGAKKTQERLVQELQEKYGNISREEMRIKIRETLNRDDRVGVADVGKTMEELEKSRPNLFQIPVWMAYILRAFSVLEGIGLDANPDYSIVSECYPYLARRLLTDDHPRANAALKTILFGGQDTIDVDQLEKMSKGFSSFSKQSVSVTESVGVQAALDEMVALILAPDGNFVQRLLIEQVTAILDAGGREAVSNMLTSFPGSILREALRTQRSVTESMPEPLKFALSPLLFPGDLLSSLYPLVAVTDKDVKTLDSFEKLLSILSSSPAPGLVGSDSSGSSNSASLGQKGLNSLTEKGNSPSPALSSRLSPQIIADALSKLNQTEVQELLNRYKDLTPGAQATGLRLLKQVLSRTRERVLESAAKVESRAQLDVSQQTSKRFITVLDQLLTLAEERIQNLEAPIAKGANGVFANPNANINNRFPLATFSIDSRR
eukprot:CAMPEP_0184479412 /NCGR_PEP_ID=MMETSP0113_2-20130426/1150_1 /TAXON_ID=91329 /ORGANISM="Norrisiella sphaerica, Strain BC52" /LENGTH=896 /DNA_ID=CAMNT_0026857495 /DNA_START=618 /DNA_END=3308 /DNA_ORIENTATION=-